MGDVQALEGYCLLLPDPVVRDLNSLGEKERTQYSLDMIRIGDALLKVTDAYRINYETWGNSDQALHTHITPRYMNEPENKRCRPTGQAYDWKAARKFDLATDKPLMEKMKQYLDQYA